MLCSSWFHKYCQIWPKPLKNTSVILLFNWLQREKEHLVQIRPELETDIQKKPSWVVIPVASRADISFPNFLLPKEREH